MDTDSDNDTSKTLDTTTKSSKLAVQGVTLDVTPVSSKIKNGKTPILKMEKLQFNVNFSL